MNIAIKNLATLDKQHTQKQKPCINNMFKGIKIGQWE